MLQSDQLNEYNRLLEKYKKMSDEELAEILNNESRYTEVAVKAASDVLQSDKREYRERLGQEQQIENEKTKMDKDEALISICKDIHSIKNMLLFFVILTVLGIISVIYLGFELDNYLKDLFFWRHFPTIAFNNEELYKLLIDNLPKR